MLQYGVCVIADVFNPFNHEQYSSHKHAVAIYVTGFWKTVPNHTFLFQYIYHCNMKSIAFPIIFHNTTRNSMLKLLKEYKKYSVNTHK